MQYIPENRNVYYNNSMIYYVYCRYVTHRIVYDTFICNNDNTYTDDKNYRYNYDCNDEKNNDEQSNTIDNNEDEIIIIIIIIIITMTVIVALFIFKNCKVILISPYQPAKAIIFYCVYLLLKANISVCITFGIQCNYIITLL